MANSGGKKRKSRKRREEMTEEETAAAEMEEMEEAAVEEAEQQAVNSPADVVAPINPTDALTTVDKSREMAGYSEMPEPDENEEEAPAEPTDDEKAEMEMAVNLPLDPEATEKMDVKAAAKATGVDRKKVLAFAVRGNDDSGRYAITVTEDGQKHVSSMKE